MRYVLVSDNTVVRYPYSHADLKNDNPGISVPDVMPDERFALYNVFPVLDSPKPEYDLTKNIVEGTPAFSDGAWRQTWVEVDASPAEIASRQEAVAQALEREAAKADAWITAFLAMTPAQAEQHVITNGTTVAKLAALTGKLAYLARFFARRELGY